MVHQCNECDSSFREKKNLQQHMRKRHGLKRYKCGYCNDRFDNQKGDFSVFLELFGRIFRQNILK